MGRHRAIATGGIVVLLLSVAPVTAESFWCGGDLKNALPAEVVESLQTALEEAYNAIQGVWFTFSSDGPADAPPTGVLVHHPEKTWDGYTLLSCLGGHFDENTGTTYGAILIDMQGAIVKEWPLVPYPARMLPGGHVMGGMGLFEEFTGVPQLVQLDWDGNRVWEWNGCASSFAEAPYHSGFHHDYQREGCPIGYYVPGMPPMVEGGKTLILSHYIPPLEWTAHMTTHPLFDDALYEVDWDGNLTWEWHLWEHYDQLGFSAAARQAIFDNYVGRVPDVGSDYQHTNAASHVGPNKWYDQGDLRFHPDNIMIDCRSSNIIMIIARHDHPEGQWQAGDIVWKVGPDYRYGRPEYKLGQIIGQHQAHLVPQGLPGAGNVLLFDNGGLAGFGPLMPGLKPMVFNKLRDYSRVLEFDPVTLDIVWEYACPEAKVDADGNVIEPAFFSTFVSGVQRFVNGNTLVCEGQTGRVFEITPDKEIVWDFASPFGGGDTGMGFLGFNTIYRADRIPYSWIPLDVEMLTNGQTVTNLYGGAGRERLYRIDVPDGSQTLELVTVGGSGNCDLYVQHGARPTPSQSDLVLAQPDNHESISITNPLPGTWYVLLRGEQSYTGVTLELGIQP